MIRLDYHLGFGGNPFRLPALPNAIWFLGASKESYLSFKNPSTGGFDGFASQTAGNGFLAQFISFAKVSSGRLILAGLTLPFSRKSTRRLMSRVIAEDGIRLSVDVTEWHRYRLVGARSESRLK